MRRWGIERFANEQLTYSRETTKKEDIMQHWKFIKDHCKQRFKNVEVVYYLVEYKSDSIDDDILLDTFEPKEVLR